MYRLCARYSKKILHCTSFGEKSGFWRIFLRSGKMYKSDQIIIKCKGKKPVNALLQKVSKQALHVRQIQKYDYLQKEMVERMVPTS